MPQDLAPVPVEGPHSPEEIDLFGDYRFLVPIIVAGETALVPEGNNLLRALQYLDVRHGRVRLSWATFCWNDTTGCCQLRFRVAPGGPIEEGRACRTAVRPGLEIIELPKGGRVCR